MGLRRASLILYILFTFHLHHNFPSVSSRSSSSVAMAMNHETLPLKASKPDHVAVFKGKARELAVVIKKRGGGGRGGGGGGSRGSSRGGGSNSNQVGRRVVPVGTGGGSHTSSGSWNLRGAVCAVGWLGLSVLTALFLV